MMLSVILSLYFLLGKINCEEFNLFGESGQSYALEAYLGHPHQKVHLIIDTGSTTLAIAAYSREENDVYFHANESTSIFNSGKDVQARYSQGKWWGKLASDIVHFPSLSIPEVRSDIALITKSENFFMNGSGWQGLLGLAYLPVGAWGNNVIVESWIDSLDRTTNKQMSFQMKLCGPIGVTNATHYGKFQMIEDEAKNESQIRPLRTTILRKRWYEIGVISIRVLTNSSANDYTVNDSVGDIDSEVCRTLNAAKSILDSGTTNIRMPDSVFRQIVDQLRSAAQTSNVLILDNFWYHGEAGCWNEPQDWSLPSIAIDLLNDDQENQYFTLEIPSQNYMRVIKAHNNTGEDGIVSEYCYKLGLEGSKETVLGYTAMEGFEVLFNRSASWISFQPSDCGSQTRITGPYNVTTSLKSLCDLTRPIYHHPHTSIKAAQWTLCAISIVASTVLIYLLAPCVKSIIFKRRMQSLQISLSQAALVEQENS